LKGKFVGFKKKFAYPEGRIYFHQSIQYSYKVGKYCINSSSPEEFTGFNGVRFATDLASLFS
jgi:hypothetical protein